jgi:rare lipoprotein A
MQKFHIRISGCLLFSLITGCSIKPPSPVTQIQPAQPVWLGPVKEIPGIEPVYEPENPELNQDYWKEEIQYKVLKNTNNFTETGLVAIYADSLQGKKMRSGETFDAEGFTAGHARLPIPSYLRVTNLANNRQIVVKVNDRATYQQGRIITLTSGVANRLNLAKLGRVKIEIIHVAPDNSLSGPGNYGTIVGKQSYDLPKPPALTISTTPLTSPAAE